MPLPKPIPTESNTEFLDRCMSHETMVSEYPRENQRYAVCNNLLKDKKETKKNEQKLAREWVRQLKIAEKNKKKLNELKIEEIKRIEPKLNNDVFKVFDLIYSINSKTSFGGTSFVNIKKMIRSYKKDL